ncbi:MAG: M20/M25/M40 family metallo-hydrolase [candidate division KSB1 bacterium]|nr:M20/M25/M40 family metallo-hydrolase [candidate division KSB1 bacterium]
MKVDEQKLLELFFQLIRIDSISLHERAMADFLIQKFKSWQIEVSEDEAASKIGGNAGNLIARLQGKSANVAPLILLAHMDTVRSTAKVNPVINNGIIRSDGNTILGADNRSGVALILYVINEIIEKKLAHRSLEIVFTVAEELGMFGALALDYHRLTAKEGYIFDCSAKPGSYVAESPTAYDFKVHCQGRPAHSAVAPEKGINAISMALAIMNQFPVGRINKETVANIGTIHGGSADNVVPDQVTFTGEFRSFSASEINRLKSQLENSCHLVSQKFGGKCEVSFKLGFEGYRFEPTMPVIERLHRSMQQLNLVPNAMVYSGGSDVNVLNANGIRAVNVGIGASNPHSNEEQIALADMVQGAELLFRLVEAEEA